EYARWRYLSRHPKAALYAGFADFALFCLSPETALLNGGFGKAYRLTRHDLLTAGPLTPLSEVEQGAVEHMNKDHVDAVENYAVRIAEGNRSAWALTGFAVLAGVGEGARAVSRFYYDLQDSDASALGPMVVGKAKEPPGN